jgi:hypothetical protein
MTEKGGGASLEARALQNVLWPHAGDPRAFSFTPHNGRRGRWGRQDDGRHARNIELHFPASWNSPLWQANSHSASLKRETWEKLEDSCKIWGFHGGDYEECLLLGSYAVWLLQEPTFRRNLAPPSSGWQESVNKEQHKL